MLVSVVLFAHCYYYYVHSGGKIALKQNLHCTLLIFLHFDMFIRAVFPLGGRQDCICTASMIAIEVHPPPRAAFIASTKPSHAPRIAYMVRMNLHCDRDSLVLELSIHSTEFIYCMHLENKAVLRYSYLLKYIQCFRISTYNDELVQHLSVFYIVYEVFITFVPMETAFT